MIVYKDGQLSKKEQHEISGILIELSDSYNDFYITKNNLRLFIKENSDLLYKYIKQGDKIIYEEGSGVIFVTGFGEKFPRKYIKILAKDEKSADKLLKVALWNIKCDKLWVKIKKNNPIKTALEKNCFYYAGNRGREVLLCRNKSSMNRGER